MVCEREAGIGDHPCVCSMMNQQLETPRQQTSAKLFSISNCSFAKKKRMNAYNWPRLPKIIPADSSSKPTLLIIFAFFLCACGIELQLPETYEKCNYTSGILSFAAERYLSPEELVSMGAAAQCLAQSAVLSHGMLLCHCNAPCAER